MKKFSLRAKNKTRLLLAAALAQILCAAASAAIFFVLAVSEAMLIGAALALGGSITFLYFFNYEYDFCIDYENQVILASVLRNKEKSEEEKNEEKIFFAVVLSAEILEKEAIEAEFGFEKAPSSALALRGAEKSMLVPLNWFSLEQRAEILEECKKIAGAYL